MNTSIYYPCKTLQPYISHYRIWSAKTPIVSEQSFRDYPRTIMDMLFILEGKVSLAFDNALPFQLDKCSFISQFDKSYTIFPTGNIQFINVRFKPNGIYPLTKIPLFLLLNGHLPLSELIGNQVNLLYEKLQHQPSDLQKINLLENYLVSIFQKTELHYKLEHALHLIHTEKGLIAVKMLKEQLRTNYKSLDRWFQKNVGLPPKRFIQLTRFKHIIDELKDQAKPDWMQIVADYNFYDQAHFIKEFKQFAGVCPSNYRTSTLS